MTSSKTRPPRARVLGPKATSARRISSLKSWSRNRMGYLPILFLDQDFNEDIRLALVAFGPNTLALGGRVFDDVILHTYFTPETLQRCVTTVKSAAEKAGRDPDSVRVWSCFATVGAHLPEQLRLEKTVARLATYLP